LGCSKPIEPCLRYFTTTLPTRSGSNKWSKTKHIKAGTDKKKMAERTYFAKQLAMFSRIGGDNLQFNSQLANMVAAATKACIPKNVIQDAISRGQGRSLSGTQLQNITLEGMIPPSIAIVVEAETDNKTRTIGDLKHLLKKGGAVATPSTWYFERLGRTIVKMKNDGPVPPSIHDDLVDESLNHEGIWDISVEGEAGSTEATTDSTTFSIWTQPANLSNITQAYLDKFNFEIVESDIVYKPDPDRVLELADMETAKSLGFILEGCAEYPEVKAIYVNVRRSGDLTDEVWEPIERNMHV
jgi:transcriptional/translational regulatory protein YebC/TACO1